MLLKSKIQAKLNARNFYKASIKTVGVLTVFKGYEMEKIMFVWFTGFFGTIICDFKADIKITRAFASCYYELGLYLILVYVR